MLKIIDKLYPALIVGTAAAFPFASSAQTTIQQFLSTSGQILQTIINLLFIVVTIVFFWGVIKFVASAGDEEAKKQGKALMTWGIVGLAVMLVLWGIVVGLATTFGLQQTAPPVPNFIK